MPFYTSDRIKIITRYKRDSVLPVSDPDGVSIKHIIPPIGSDIILVGVHLPSKLFAIDIDHTALSIRLSQAIIEAEKKVGHDRTIVIGDFNMNPFEDGMIASDGLHTVMDRNIANRICRTVYGKECKFFYNPMWSLMGDFSTGPPGTFYYQSSGQKSFFWNAFDQVLLRPSLIEYFNQDDIKVITKIGNSSILTKKGKPDKRNFSDHLPITIKLSIEKGD